MSESVHHPAFMVAASGSGCGKTTVTLGLLAALRQRGHRVRSCKVGPDHIDPLLHSAVTGQDAHNLDGWLYTREQCRAIFNVAVGDGRPVISVVEGVMGLFDSADAASDAGSSAQIAKWLDIPVLLVLNAQGVSTTIAALAQGLTGFDPQLRFAGVVCNNTGSDKHRRMLTETLGRYLPHVPLLGCLPRDPAICLPSRHLGLVAHSGACLPQTTIDALAAWMETNLDLDALCLAIDAPPRAQRPPLAQAAAMPATPPRSQPPAANTTRKKIRLAVSKDEAFFFLNHENLRLLRDSGAQIVFFSPLHDTALPPDIQGLYLCGGYPELYAGALAANSAMRQGVLEHIRSGVPTWAAGGGFIYLCASLQTPENAQENTAQKAAAGHNSFAMAGHFPFHVSLHPRLQSLGYRNVTCTRASLWGAQGSTLRGHEFRYCALQEIPATEADACPATLFSVADKTGAFTMHEGYFMPGQPDTVGTYIHLHLASAPSAAQAFIRRCHARQRR